MQTFVRCESRRLGTSYNNGFQSVVCGLSWGARAVGSKHIYVTSLQLSLASATDFVNGLKSVVTKLVEATPLEKIIAKEKYDVFIPSGLKEP